jgi:hypothetical protein
LVAHTEQMQLHAIDREGTPPYPRGSCRRVPPACRLRNLARMEHFQECRVHKQGFRIAYQLGEDLPPQRFQITPEFPHTPIEGGRMQPRYSRKQVREESLGIPQKRAFTLHTPKLLEKGESDDLRIREVFEGFVASSAMRVEQCVGVVYEAEQHGQSLFQVGKRGGMLGVGHPTFLSLRVRMALVVPSIHATHI